MATILLTPELVLNGLTVPPGKTRIEYCDLHPDARSLYIDVSASNPGHGVYRVRQKIDGKTTHFVIGKTSEVTLQSARQQTVALKSQLAAGVNPKATQEAFAGGWFHSGDLAVQYPDGYIKIKDRSKDIIISGGENISSIEVEDVLYRHPAVLAAAVVAKPDARWGETPCAFVELKADAQVTAEQIVAHCKLHLAGFKVPRAVVFGELPKTSTGKIQKFELRKQAGSAQAIDV